MSSSPHDRRPHRWRCVVTGTGRPLVLLHGIGMSHHVWDPLLPLLRPSHATFAFDLPGFGATPPLPDGITPTVAHLADALEPALRAAGLTCPVDFVGNSLGGALALECARRGLARSVVALSPAGLWTSGPPAHVPYVFRVSRFLATRAGSLLKASLRSGVMRELVLSVPLSAGSRRMSHADAARTVDDLARAVAFEETFAHTCLSFAARDIDVPITVVFGSRDWLLTASARQRSTLPDHARWLTMPSWGHVPMWVDPAGVADVISAGTAIARRDRAPAGLAPATSRRDGGPSSFRPASSAPSARATDARQSPAAP